MNTINVLLLFICRYIKQKKRYSCSFFLHLGKRKKKSKEKMARNYMPNNINAECKERSVLLKREIICTEHQEEISKTERQERTNSCTKY